MKQKEKKLSRWNVRSFIFYDNFYLIKSYRWWEPKPVSQSFNSVRTIVGSFVRFKSKFESRVKVIHCTSTQKWSHLGENWKGWKIRDALRRRKKTKKCLKKKNSLFDVSNAFMNSRKKKLRWDHHHRRTEFVKECGNKRTHLLFGWKKKKSQKRSRNKKNQHRKYFSFRDLKNRFLVLFFPFLFVLALRPNDEKNQKKKKNAQESLKTSSIVCAVRQSNRRREFFRSQKLLFKSSI